MEIRIEQEDGRGREMVLYVNGQDVAGWWECTELGCPCEGISVRYGDVPSLHDRAEIAPDLYSPGLAEMLDR